MNTQHSSLVIGTYTRRHLPLRLLPVRGRPAGLLAAGLAAGADLTGLTVLAEPPNPSWVTATSDGRYLYAVAETKKFGGEPGGGIAAYARDPATGAITLLNTVCSGGAEPAHLELDPSERFAIVANYGSGSVAVFAREADGRLAAMTGHVQHQGPRPHPHQICFDPVTGDVLVPDKGLDAVFGYRLGEDGSLTERPAARIAGSPGSGPRHLAVHPDGQHLFLANELVSSLVVLRRDGDRFTGAGTACTVPDGFTGRNYPSTVRVSASGRWVLAANRGHNSIAVFGFDPATGELGPPLVQPCGGRWPRDFVFSPDGARLLVANQRSGTVALFGFDERQPRLRFVSATAVLTPACLRFVPLIHN
ncbi:MAG TPA: lactonase family protein [Streptosporangiaceae bacterium]